MSGEVITHDGRDFAPTGEQTRPELCDCGHAPTPRGIAAGYARDATGRTLCYACAEAEELRAFNAADRAWLGYLTRGDDGQLAITTWTGARLATVTSMRETKARGFYGVRYTRVYWRAVDAQGRRWYGTSPGVGTYARMRRAAE